MELERTDAGIEVTTGDAPALAVIWLHGLGADGNDFVPIVPELDLPCATRFVFPHAPERPVTINGGMRMRAWYDIVSFSPDTEDGVGIRESAATLGALVEREEARGLATERIVVAGFSQGGAIALHAGLRFERPLGGVLALSTYLPLGDTLATEASPANRGVSIWMAHGREDPMVGVALAERSRARLIGLGYDVEWHDYRMGHSVCAEEIRDIGRWLSRFG